MSVTHRLEDGLMAIRAERPPALRTPAPSGHPAKAGVQTHLRMALNLLTDDPTQPSGAHWCWTRIVPEMANRLLPGEELHLMLSPSARHYFPDDGDAVRCITFPWSNEHRVLRTASEHLVTPFRLPLRHIDLLSTAIAPLVKPTRSLVIHMKTMHAFTVPETVGHRSSHIPPTELPAFGPHRGRCHRQLQQPACRDRPVSRGRLPEGQPDLRGGRPRHLQTGRPRCRSRSCRAVRDFTAIRAVRIVPMALQER